MAASTVGDTADQSSREGLHRLEDIEVREVSLVDRPANKRSFLIVKRSGEMAEDTKDLSKKLTEAEAKSTELQKSLDDAQAETAKLKKDADDAPDAGELQKSLDEAQAEITTLKEAAEKKAEPKDGEADDEAAKLQKSIDERDTKITKLQEQADEADKLAKRVVSLEQDKSKTEHAEVFKTLKADGKLPKSLEEWAGKQSAEALTAWGEGAPAVLKSGRTKAAGSVDGTLVLTDVEKEVAKSLNISEDDYIESRKAEIKKSDARKELLAQ